MQRSGKVLVPDLENGGEPAKAVDDWLNKVACWEAESRAAYEAERRMGA
jgi:hypothetical protein